MVSNPQNGPTSPALPSSVIVSAMGDHAAPPFEADGPSAAATADDDLFCLTCDYNLRGLTVHRCPECGTPFDPAALVVRSAPWGPLAWESAGPRRRLARVARTFAGLALHPARCLQHLGAAPRPFGRRQWLFAPWALALTVILPPITIAVWYLRIRLLLEMGLPVRPYGLGELWWMHQAFWLDNTLVVFTHTGLILALVGLVSLLPGPSRDSYGELALLAPLLGLVAVTALLIPSPFALAPTALLAGATFVLGTLRSDRVRWGRLISRTARNLVYLVPLALILQLYVRLVYYVVHVVWEIGSFSPDALVRMHQVRSLIAASLFAGVMYLFCRHSFHTIPIRAAGIALLYVGIDRFCLGHIPYYVRIPVQTLFYKFGLIDELQI